MEYVVNQYQKCYIRNNIKLTVLYIHFSFSNQSKTRRTVMKTKNKLFSNVIMHLLLLLCAITISLNLTIYGIHDVQDIQDSHYTFINSNYYNTSKDNSNSYTLNTIRKINNHNISNKFIFELYNTIASGNIIIFIQIKETYFLKQLYFSKLYKRSLITQKIRLNN